jgi:hypothetical protein
MGFYKYQELFNPSDPVADQIRQLPQLPPAELVAVWRRLHGALGAEGYRLGIKYLDTGIYVPIPTDIDPDNPPPTPRSSKSITDPIHVYFPQFRPADHPTEADYPKPPISPQEAEFCLADLQKCQSTFQLFERETKNSEGMTIIDPRNYAWYSKNIYNEPMHSEFYFLSIDDINTDDRKNYLQNIGIMPTLKIIKSQYECTCNEQWIIKIPKLPEFCQHTDIVTHFRNQKKRPAIDNAMSILTSLLNKGTADKKIKQCTSDFVVPGFYQLSKENIQKGINSITTINHAESCICKKATSMYHEINNRLIQRKKQHMVPVTIPSPPVVPVPPSSAAPVPSLPITPIPPPAHEAKAASEIKKASVPGKKTKSDDWRHNLWRRNK